MKTSAQKWSDELDIKELLRGTSLGNRYSHASRVLGGMRGGQKGKKVKEETPQSLLLSGHLELYKKAELLLPKGLKTLSKTERLATCKELALNGIELPPFTCGSLLSQAASEEVDMSAFVKMLSPSLENPEAAEAGDFQPSQPRLQDTGLAFNAQGKLVDSCVTNTLMKLMAGGEGSKDKVMDLARVMVAEWKPLTDGQGKEVLGEVFSTGLKDLCEVGEFFLALAGEIVDAEQATKKVNNVMQSTSGTQLFAKQV